MSSRRTIVDRSTVGDAFTYALLSLIALGADARSIAADSRPHLRLVANGDDDQSAASQEIPVESALLGFIALGDLARRLIPETVPAELPEAETAPEPLRPRELLR